jgi:protein TonB
VSLFFPRGVLPAGGAGTGARGIGSALLVHGLIVLVALLGLGSAKQIADVARPIAVRLIEDTPPQVRQPEPPPPQPPRPQRKQERPPPVLASNTPAPASNFVVAEQPVVAPAPPAPPAPVVESVTEARFDADYLSNPKPPYPPASRRLGETGTVYLRVHVSEDGRALKVDLKKSSGFARLDQSALDTVAQWRFVPARRGQTPVVSWVVVPVVFSLT